MQRLPSIDALLREEPVKALLERYSRALVLEEVRRIVAEARSSLNSGELDDEGLTSILERFPALLEENLEGRLSPGLGRMVNASGVILHTNAGRAPIAPSAAAGMVELAGSYSNLEYDLESGRRGHRDVHFEKRIKRLLDCSAATACNNNAASLLLILNTLAKGKNVLVSRGQLIEIGGSFRLPSIMESSGAILREVGTTNKTRLADFQDAIDENTGLIMRVHASNFKIVGFTEQPTLPSMVALGRETGIPFVEDVGSGYLFPTGHDPLSSEPTVQKALQEEVDLVCFSGDKLLGGPQAGIILGRTDLVERIRKNPLMRACRLDKMAYAALEHTLLEYEKGAFRESIPIYRMLSLSPTEIRSRAQQVMERLDRGDYRFELRDGESLIGGGAAPEEKLATCLIAIQPRRGSVNELEARLRRQRPPILARIEKDSLIFDLRTVHPQEDGFIVSALQDFADDPSA